MYFVASAVLHLPVFQYDKYRYDGILCMTNYPENSQSLIIFHIKRNEIFFFFFPFMLVLVSQLRVGRGTLDWIGETWISYISEI